MNLDGICSAIRILADIEAIAEELAENHTDDRTSHVFGWLARESEKARTHLASCAEGVANAA